MGEHARKQIEQFDVDVQLEIELINRIQPFH